MTILEATPRQFDAATRAVMRRRVEPKHNGEIEALGMCWMRSAEFRDWLEAFGRLGLPAHVVASILSVGVELGYALREVQEGGARDA